jgi:hypothetical protein
MTQTTNPSWWNRNAKWAVPVTVLVVLLSVAGFAFGIISIVFGMMKSIDAYQQAVIRATANPIVIEALGTPITEGFFTSGHVETTGPSGSAALAIPIVGPKGSATIYLEASKSAGEWTFSKLVVEITGTKQRIDLLASPTAKMPPRSSPGWHDLAVR